MILSTTMMLAILDGHGEPQERQEMRRRMQEAGVDAPLQRWRAVGARLELTLLNGKIIYLPQEAASEAQQEQPGQAAIVSQEAARAAPQDGQPAQRGSRAGRKPRTRGAHGIHP